MTIDLDALLDAINERRVVPVVGRALSAWDNDGQRTTLDEIVATGLAAKLGLMGVGAADPTLRFTEDVALSYKAPPGRGRRVEVRKRFNEVLASPSPAREIPPGLRKLAQIPEIDLVLSVTFDSLLEKALEQEQPGKRVLTSTGYSLSRPEDLLVFEGPHVHIHHLFGSGGDFALFDDEHVAAVLRLKEILKAGISELCKHLQGPSPHKGTQLLFLGCSFPDWLMRFLVLAFARENQPPEGKFVDRDLGGARTLRLFLETWEIEPSDEDVHTFVSALVNRRQERIRDGLPQLPERATVVFSCHPDDLNGVRAIQNQLLRWGIETALVQPAQSLDDVKRIMQKAALYVACLSGSVLSATAYDRARMEEEWRFVASLVGQGVPNAEQGAPLAAHVVSLTNGADFRKMLGRPGHPLTSSPRIMKWDTADDLDLRLVRRLFELGHVRLPGAGRLPRAAGSKLRLFCIHSEKDAAAVVEKLAPSLKKVPWLDLQYPRNVPVGGDWREAMTQADAFLLLGSPDLEATTDAQQMIRLVLEARSNVPRHRVLYRDFTPDDDMMSFASLPLSRATAISDWETQDGAWKEVGSTLQRELLNGAAAADHEAE